MDITKLKEQLINHEALRLSPYLCTSGKTTIGVGRNLDDMGITEEEAMFLLDNDIVRVIGELKRNFPPFDHMSENRQIALIDMGINLGIGRLMRFKKMFAALEAGKYRIAAAEALDSKWADQVGNRALTIADLIKKG